MLTSLSARTQLLRVVLLLAVLLLLPSATYAWGPKGHRIIARLAWQQLSPGSKRKVEELLGKSKDVDPLTDIATWADDQRLKSPRTRPWHFVDIPLSSDSYDQRRDCPKYDCVVEMVNRFKNQLQSGKTRQERIDALKYLVHLVGDLHQPLHCSDNKDAGGNKVQVTLFGKVTNLHDVWDSEMIERTGLDYETYAIKLQVSLPVDGGWVYDWANESHRLAKNAYQLPVDKALGNAYYKANLPIVDRQLARAGARLAKVLEAALNPAQQKAVKPGEEFFVVHH